MTSTKVSSVSPGGSADADDLEAQRDRLVEAAAQLAPDISDLIRVYYRHAPPEDIVDDSPEDLLAAVRSHLELAERRPPGRPAVKISNPARSTGGSSGVTVVQIVTDDMPFLVDSVVAKFARSGMPVQRIVHPILLATRDVTGALQQLHPAADLDDPPEGASAESWISVEVDQITDPERAAAVETGLISVITDVREVVEDSVKMTETALQLADELESSPPPLPPTEVTEGAALLRWLVDGHFRFLGYRKYEVVRDQPDPVAEDAPVLRAVLATGLGVLRQDSLAARKLTAGTDIAKTALSKNLLVLTPGSARSTVHRPVRPYYIGVKTFDDNGEVTGEHRFLGMFTTSALHEDVLDIPVVGRRVRDVIHRAGFPMDSHSGQAMLEVIQSWPRAELFSTDPDSLYATATGAIALADRRRIRAFLRRDPYRRFFSCVVFVPRDRYSTRSRQAMQEVLREELQAREVEFAVRLGETLFAQVHFTAYTDPDKQIEPDMRRIQQRLTTAVRGWEDQLIEAIHEERVAAGVLQSHRDEPATQLGERLAAALPEAYKEDFDAVTGLRDLRQLESLSGPGDLGMQLYACQDEHDEATHRFKLYLAGEGVSLSKLLPMLQKMDVEVIDQRPYDITMPDGSRAWIYDFGLRVDQQTLEKVADPESLSDLGKRFQDAFRAMWDGAAEIDGLNGLVLRSGLTWRQTSVLRAYSRYLQQAGTPYSQAYIERTVLANPQVAAALIDLFELKFDVADGEEVTPERRNRVEQRAAEIESMIDSVESLDEDRILRGLLTLIKATLRTNYYRTDDNGEHRSYLSFKLEPTAVPDLPEPRPRFEIFVCSPRVEGVHLRFGSVARGGLRWSDRREDYRTEILGLVKAQAVKNSVIVPVGAKGGFVVKNPPAPTGDPAADREALQAEGIACYRMFISGLLDLTDNRRDGKTVPAPQVVRYDDDDSYLVVAADKGTATFSDIANEVSLAYGHWLGDAFASGGSAGYDHKEMGITARGAWESVKRHFRELGIDTQTQDFTVVGIGDMSGDVFGNGMLLSEHIRLVAAFNHMHIFVDPDPDPAISFRERKRLFELPRSTWADYDRSLISKGGGVFERSAKTVVVTPEMRRALGLPDEVTKLTPNELVRAILLAPVDLLWNGGIGTYVKASTESHADAGDKTNDAVRVDGNQLRVKVVGEGGNLGFTQRGRIEFARNGGKINTDALDNSAGVDSSDHEVNIKILLEQAIARGELSQDERVPLLESMTDEVAELVLRHNYRQNAVLGVSRAHAAPMASVHQRLVSYLEEKAGLDRQLEALPSNQEFKKLIADGEGLTSPELATILAHVKLDLKDELIDSDLPDQDVFAQRLPLYFPTPLRERFAEAIQQHPLKRQIITTQVVNEVVDGAGLSYAFRLAEEMNATATDAVRAYMVVTRVFDLPAVWRDIEALDNVVSTDVADRMVLETRRLLDRAARWWLSSRPQPLAVGAEINRFSGVVRALQPKVPELLRGEELDVLNARRDELIADGVPEDLAGRVAALLFTYGLLDVTEVAELAEQEIGVDRERSPLETAELYYALSEHLGINRMLTSVTALERGNRWHALARLALRDDIYLSLRAITLDALRISDPGDPVDAKIEQWERANSSRLARARVALDDIARVGKLDLATLSVATRQLRSMAR